MDKEIEGILNRKDEHMCMDEKLCNERMKKTEEHQARQDLRLDNHSTRLDQLEQYRAGFEIQIGHLCEKDVYKRQELDEFIESGQSYEDLAERKLRAMLEVDITPIDAHMIENIERNSTGAIAKVRDAMEEIDVTKAEIKKDTKELQKEIERQTSVIMELALMLSQVGVYEETEENEETNNENTDTNPVSYTHLDVYKRQIFNR